MSARTQFRSARWAATAALALVALPALAQPAPPPPVAPVPPEPPRAMRAITIGGSGSYLGIGVKEILADRAKELKLKEEAGIEVTRVDSGSPAEKAGIKSGDVVLEYQGTRVEGTEQFVRLVRETPVGRNAKLKIVRGGSTQTVTATIGSRQQAAWAMSEKDHERLERDMARLRERMKNLPEIRVPDVPRPVMGWRSGMIGIEGEALEDQLAEYFGVKEGVLVRSVAKDMPAAKAGLRAGDVIVRIEDAKVRAPRDITSAIRSAKNRKPLKVVVMRQRSEMTLDVQLDEERERPAPGPRGATIGHPQQEF